jgi:hypothetical protein
MDVAVEARTGPGLARSAKASSAECSGNSLARTAAALGLVPAARTARGEVTQREQGWGFWRQSLGHERRSQPPHPTRPSRFHTTHSTYSLNTSQLHCKLTVP